MGVFGEGGFAELGGQLTEDDEVDIAVDESGAGRVSGNLGGGQVQGGLGTGPRRGQREAGAETAGVGE